MDLPLTNRPPTSPSVRSYVVECRDPETGRLDLKSPQPPFIEASSDALASHYYRAVSGESPASWDVIGRWYAERRWFWRPKTW